MRLWARSIVWRDPRRQINDYFATGDERGPLGFLQSNGWRKKDNVSSHFFAVFRPTSLTALQLMISGTAKGKGLNIKGKSAKTGKLSGLVPFLQITDNKHKTRVGTPAHAGRIDVYFQTRANREQVLLKIGPVLGDMERKAAVAKAQLALFHATKLHLEDDELIAYCEARSNHAAHTCPIRRGQYTSHHARSPPTSSAHHPATRSPPRHPLWRPPL